MELDYVRTDVYDLPGMKVGRYLCIVHGADYHYDETDYVRQWFALKCAENPDKNLNNFVVHSIENYDSKSHHQNPIYDSFVPVMFQDNY